ncbi:MAG: DsbA family protein [Campylobacterales bacterium]|nr:DsbA family protein [Campylobacterales bacterium]
MSLMLRLLSVLMIVMLSSSCAADVEKKQLLRYMNDSVIKNPEAKAVDVEIYETQQPKELQGWSALFTKMKIEFKNEKVDVPELIFIKDGLATSSLVNLNTRKDYSAELKPSVQPNMYDAKHLLAGNSNAVHKIILFSDPLCPFCREIFPRMIKTVEEHPETFALYYYHLPLTRIHPGVETLTKIMYFAQKDKKLDVIKKIYAIQLHVNPNDPKAIIDAVAKETGFNVGLDQIDSKEVNDALKKDKEEAVYMMVGGTPTVYLDGKWDKIRETYMNYIPKK